MNPSDVPSLLYHFPGDQTMNPYVENLNCDIGGSLNKQQTLSYKDIEELLRINSGKIRFSDTLYTCDPIDPEKSDETCERTHPFQHSYDPIVPEKFDILCGRDRMASTHIGNKRYRVIIAMNRERYQNAKTRDQKTRITNEVISTFQKSQPGGRFLKFDPNSNAWYDVGLEYAHEKVSHALRSAKDPNMKGIRKKRGEAHKIYTQREDETFKILLAEQQKIFKELLQEEEIFEDPIDFSLVEDFCTAILV